MARIGYSKHKYFRRNHSGFNVVDTRQAIKIARDTAREAGYKDASVTDVSYNEDDETFEVELEEDDVIIDVTVDEEKGDVVDFTTD